jgi:hypothetical protein
MTTTMERRSAERERSAVLKRQLNDAQLATLNTLERFGWEVKFIRRTPAGKLVVLFDPDTRRHALLDDEGELDENPAGYAFR